MRHELFIDHQRVDLGPNPSVILEWVSGIFGDIGSINLSRSYTIKLPKSAKNLMIFDDPGNPAHDSQKVRRYFDARYLRNGIDLLGDAQAYLLGVTPEDIEIALLWRSVEGLLEWKNSGKKLSDLATLPTVQWVGDDGIPDYTRGAYFSKYESGLGANGYLAVNTAPHPAVRFLDLFSAVFNEAGIRWDATIDEDGTEMYSLYEARLLCDGHRPSRAMEIASGSSTDSVSVLNDVIGFSNWVQGWDPIVKEYYGGDVFEVGDNPNIRFVINLKNGLDDYTIGSDTPIRVIGIVREPNSAVAVATVAQFFFEPDENGVEHCSVDEVVNLSGCTEFEILFQAGPVNRLLQLPAYDSELPAFSMIHSHEHINLSEQNLYPIAENLPDMTQVDFIKGACALLGIVPVVTSGKVLKFLEYDAIFDTSVAVDWTDKVAAEPEKVSPMYEGLAQRNRIRYTEDVRVYPSPDAEIITDDETLPESADLYKLPFAASDGPVALHYAVTYEFDEDTLTDIFTAKDVAIKPRVFVQTYNDGIYYLEFPYYFKGAELVKRYYNRYQAAVRKPIVIEALVRLTEVDLANLDITRPVYFRQFGQFYAVRKVQTSDTDICKVELIQLR